MDGTKGEAVSGNEGFASSTRKSLADSTSPEKPHMAEVTGTPQQGPRAEAIELGGLHLVDELNAPLVATTPKPRGLLPVPPQVEAAVAQDDAALLKTNGIVSTSADRQRQVNSLTLQYYYGGHDVAYRFTPGGVELLAIGLAEISELLQGMSQEELLTIRIGQP